MEYMIGCNYWASNAGSEMWRNWDEDAIREDMKILSEHKIEYLRVFPIWRDFQPVEPIYTAAGRLVDYRLHAEYIPTNPYYLDEQMVERFLKFCDICQEYGMKLIVGLVTGFMSGKMYIPAALYEKNLFSDPLALYFQQKYVSGLVQMLKHHEAIVSWDLGNECGGMGVVADQYMAEAWTAAIANAVKANDQTRPLVSGFNTIVPEANERKWTIKGQAENCDILTTHPYSYFSKFTFYERTASFRRMLHATCESKLYADIGGKPCCVEEVGTLGSMLCDYDLSADFMRVNLISNWANGSLGVLWWCANEQLNLRTTPYTYQMIEVELGMIDKYRNPKPVLKETKRIAEILENLPFKLPQAEEDAVCILTQDQQQWGVAYMTYCLAKQAGLNLRFAYSKDEIPNAKVYLMPSVCGWAVMPQERYFELKKKVANGAKLYISNDTGVFAEFEELTGMHVEDSGRYNDSLTAELEGEEFAFRRTVRYEMKAAGARVLSLDSLGYPAISEYQYGEGIVNYVNFPLESMLLEKTGAFDGNNYQVYRKLFRETIEKKTVRTENPYIGLTLHPSEEGCVYCVAVNYSPESQKLNLIYKDGTDIAEIYYGNVEELKPFEAVIFKVN